MAFQRHKFFATVGLVGLGLVACGGGTPVSVVSEAREVGRDDSRWIYHPSEPGKLMGGVDLGNGRRLLVGAGGERWLSDVGVGTVVAASVLADQDLVGVTRNGDSGYLYVGGQGGIFSSTDPLGPLVLVSQMADAPMKMAAGGGVVVAVGWDGRVAESLDGGRTFSDVLWRGHRAYDVAVGPSGRGMILGFPEQLWVSEASGWELAGTGRVGARSVVVDVYGGLVAPGIQSSVVWESGQAKPVVSARAVVSPSVELLVGLERGADAQALALERAAITEGRYYEVFRKTAVPGGRGLAAWSLGSADLGERLRWREIEGTGNCSQVAVAARGKRVVVGCLVARGKNVVRLPLFMMMRSVDGGASFAKEHTSFVGGESGMSLAVTDGGVVVVGGICDPGEQSARVGAPGGVGGVCDASAPVRFVFADDGDHKLVSSKESEMIGYTGKTGRITASGDMSYSVGVSRSGDLVVLVSRDFGETFSATPLDLDGTEFGKEGDWKKSVLRSLSSGVVAGVGGELSWVLQSSLGSVWVVLDRDGKAMSARRSPESHPTIASAGKLGMAVGSRDNTVLVSENGGETFESLTRLPTHMAKAAGFPVWCEVDGCVFGDVFTRVGWKRGRSSDGDLVVGKLTGESDGVERDVPARRQILCEVIASAFGTVDNVIDAGGIGAAGTGKSVWSAVTVDRGTGAVNVVHAAADSVHKVRTVELFGPVADVSKIAIKAHPELEGASAVRFGFSNVRDEVAPGVPMIVEVAWENAIEGVIGRGRFDAGVVRARDVTFPSASDRAEQAAKGNNAGKVTAQANPSIMSITRGGIFVCPHHGCEAAMDRSYFVKNNGAVEVVEPVYRRM